MDDDNYGPFGPREDERAAAGGRRVHDSESHGKTRISGRLNSVHETTVWKFRDPRATRVRIYKAGEGLPWAIADLAKKTNAAIDEGDVPGKQLGPGDVIQAAVVSYFCGEAVHKPQTTPDSPGLATLPYKLVIADGGYWTAEPALPAEALIHFNVPETVGDLIPNLTPEQRSDALVSLQLKEATYASAEDLASGEQYASPPVQEFQEVDTGGNDLFGFMNFLEHDSNPEQFQVSGEWRDLTSAVEDAALDEDPRARLKRKASKSTRFDARDFGFEGK